MDMKTFNIWFKKSGIKKRHYNVALTAYIGREAEIEDIKVSFNRAFAGWREVEGELQQEIVKLKAQISQNSTS